MMLTRSNLLFLVILLLGLELVAACNLSSHPTDLVLEERLKSNQADFDALIGMLAKDEDIVRIDDKFVFLREGSNREVPKERLQVYREFFAKLKLEGGFHRDKDNALRFIASSRGTTIPSSEKSYVYCASLLTPSVESLDYVIKKDRGDQQPVYKKLHGGWYLYYESW